MDLKGKRLLVLGCGNNAPDIHSEYLQTSIQPYDTNGELMLITHFDTNKLSFGGNIFTNN